MAGCQQCDAGDSSSCAVCQEGFIEETVAISDSMTRTTCVQFCLVPNCNTCAEGDRESCAVCESGFVIQAPSEETNEEGETEEATGETDAEANTTGNTCVVDPEAGGVVVPPGTDSGETECEVADCLNCTPSSTASCEQCAEGFSLTPHTDDPNVNICQASGQETGGESGSEEDCGVANCSVCADDNGQSCQECLAGFVLTEGTLTTDDGTVTVMTCVASDPGAQTCEVPDCQTCAEDNPNHCEVCA